jgi:Domain of unknown function (DUF6458)
MGVAVGLLLIAIGAVLAFAVHATSSSVDVHTVGWILMAVGLLGVVLDMIWWHSWNVWRAGPAYARRATYVDDPAYPAQPVQPVQPAPRRRRVVTREEDAGPPAGPPPP